MSKLHFQPEMMKTLFSHLKTADLERLVNVLSGILTSRKKTPKKETEKDLLLQINQCILPNEDLDRFLLLREKRQSKELSTEEKIEFFDFIKTEQQLQLKRIQLLKRLADLRSISVPQLMKQLEITALSSV